MFLPNLWDLCVSLVICFPYFLTISALVPDQSSVVMEKKLLPIRNDSNYNVYYRHPQTARLKFFLFANHPMKNLVKRTICICAVLFAVAIATNGQKKVEESSNLAVFIVGSAAKSAWVTTKFTAKHVVKPVLKTVFVKALPKMTLYALKKSPTIAKKITPTAIKLALL